MEQARKPFQGTHSSQHTGAPAEAALEFKKGETVVVARGARATFVRLSKSPGKAIVISNNEEVEVNISSLSYFKS